MSNNQELVAILEEAEKIMGKFLGLLSEMAKRRQASHEEILLTNRISAILPKIRRQIEETK